VIAPTIVHAAGGDAGRCENGGVLDESELRGRAEALRGMDRISAALEGAPPCFLVGGAVRDLLLRREPVDVDIAVEGEAEAVAERLAEALGGAVTAHERFGTATVTAGGVDAVNLARTRRETYAEPGALPDVEPAGLAEDLGRRDFTINAIALVLNGDAAGSLSDPHGGRVDLEAGLVRVLHERSFVDDPTRTLRAVRYAARLGFELEPDTERWARDAIAGGALATVSGSRVRDELMDLLAENEAPRSVELLRDLGADRALHPGLRADPDLLASAKLGAAETGADPALAALAALAVDAAAMADTGGGAARAHDAQVQAETRSVVGRSGDTAPAGAGRADGSAADDAAGSGVSAGAQDVDEVGDSDGLEVWIDRLGLGSGERDAVLRAAARAPALVTELRGQLRPSELRALLGGEPPEALALALALGAPEGPVLDFVERLSGARLEITGADLLAAGLPESPALGRALAETLARKLDGEVDGRDEELRVALEIARGGA
jgi:tRNA nucleotidyltransferase (CCA-adding enzyme)